MKTFQIKEDGTKYKLCENAGDLNIVRLIALKNIIAEGSSGMDFPDWQQWFSERKTFYNQGDIYTLLTHEINMAKKIESLSEGIFSDASQQIFALICLEENEVEHECDQTSLNEKLTRMAQEGLTQKEVWKYTEGFIIASPQLCGSFFLSSLVAQQKRKILQELLEDSIGNTPEPMAQQQG